ncbi:unnamed protein product [Protopolystoma xenopodis]|uniref:Secreted protein n=1 Tax=Protopolystoma xenopodis TaxID=117903 RepID=A0A3S5CRX4_9PLAT|nr:unnamed protein product [Protopolystoma xenopodis]
MSIRLAASLTRACVISAVAVYATTTRRTNSGEAFAWRPLGQQSSSVSGSDLLSTRLTRTNRTPHQVSD